MNTNINNFWSEGYVIIENVFTETELIQYKTDIKEYIKNNKCLMNAKGITIVDFVNNNKLKHIGEMKNNNKITIALNEIFINTKYRFVGHNDIGINRIVGWHKDKLNGEYAKYETIDIWSKTEDNKEHKIVKVLIYLEDHSNDDYGLKLVPKSHLNPNIQPNGYKEIKSKIGDVLIFDQRITHRGMESHPSNRFKNPRILVSFGFGENDNPFTDNFECGTFKRQEIQKIV
jgi:hypothetical protein